MADTPTYIPVLEERKKFVDYRREVWGDSFNWYRIRSWETIRYIVIHHSVTNPTNNPKSDVDYIAEIHRKKNWGGIGYHYVITADGTAWYVGDISMQRANVADKNHLVIGICLVGDFRNYNPTDEQILSAHDLCKFLISDVSALVNVKKEGWKAVVGHKGLQPTECPGPAWKGPSDSMYERIKNRIPYTPQPEPQPVIDWGKRYKELEEKSRIEREKLEGEKEQLVREKQKVEGSLSVCKADCKREKGMLLEKLENAEKENPEFPSLKDYKNSEVLARAFDIIVEEIRSKIRIFGKKKNS